jgi:hypothetical protein
LSDGLRGTPKNPFVTTDDVLAIAELGPGKYTPPRPVLPSLLASSKAALRSLNMVRGITLATANETGTGTVSVTTLSYERPFEIKEMNVTLPNVHTFTVVNTGFDNVDKAANMIFDRLTMRVSINPPAITSVSVQMYRMNDTLKKLSDRLIVLETEHKASKDKCAKSNDDTLHEDFKRLIQDFRVLEDLIKKENG